MSGQIINHRQTQLLNCAINTYWKQCDPDELAQVSQLSERLQNDTNQINLTHLTQFLSLYLILNNGDKINCQALSQIMAFQTQYPEAYQSLQHLLVILNDIRQ